MRVLLLSLLSILLTPNLGKATIDDSLRIVQLQDSMIQLVQEDQVTLADSLFHQCLQRAQQLDNLLLYFGTVTTYGAYWRDKTSAPERALEYYKEGLLDAIWRKPSKPDEWESIGWVYTHFALTFDRRLGRFQEARENYKIANQILASGNCQPDHYYVARFVYRPLGNINTRFGDYPASEVMIRQFIDVMQDSADFRRAAEGYSDLGILYQNWGKYKEAELTFQKGLALPNSHRMSQILLLINYGSFLSEVEQFDEALATLEKARQLLDEEQASARPHYRTPISLGACLEKQAAIYTERKQFERAGNTYDQVLAIYSDYFGQTQRREFGKTYIQYGNLRLAQGDVSGAIEKYQMALTQILYSYQPKNLSELPNPTTFYAENTIQEALTGLSQAYERWFEESGEIDYLMLALECQEQIFVVEQELQRSYLYESSKLFNQEESRQRCEKGIQLALQLYRKTSDPTYQWTAFVFAERSRSSLLREAFRNTQATELAGITTEQRAQERNLQYAVNQAEEELFALKQNQETSDSLILLAEEKLLQARNKRADWIRQLEEANPRYYQLKYNDEVPDLATIQSMLNRGQTMVEYFLGEEQLFVFIIGSKGLEVITKDRPDQLVDRVLAFRQSIEGYEYLADNEGAKIANYQLHGQGLYHDLISPLLAYVEQSSQLLIVPSGILDLLPFEALLSSPPPQPEDFRTYPYLLRDFEISYGYSAGLLWSLHQMPRSGKGWGGFSPSFSRSGAWSPLICSQDLLQQLAAARSGEVILDTAAVPARFKELAQRYAVLHLATHAQANPDAGDFSFIVFSDGKGGYDSLFTKDLYLLELEAELVILSACETALGTLYDSEGIISLARGFHYAGARSVLTTLWSINEAANCDLMELIYEGLDQNERKSKALQRAKLTYIEAQREPQGGHPLYWAGFQLLGNARPLEPTFPWPYLLGGLLFIPVGIWWNRRQKRKAVRALPKQLVR
jgi:CHAT domain-containing protein/tetratricopeptide (TPR) repeat protein